MPAALPSVRQATRAPDLTAEEARDLVQVIARWEGEQALGRFVEVADDVSASVHARAAALAELPDLGGRSGLAEELARAGAAPDLVARLGRMAAAADVDGGGKIVRAFVVNDERRRALAEYSGLGLDVGLERIIEALLVDPEQ